MSINPPQGQEGSGKAVKTLAIRLDDELHTQLSVLAQLDGTTVTDAIRRAIEAYVERLRTSEVLASKAQAMVEDIDREAANRRAALAQLFTAELAAEGEEASSSSRATSRRTRPAADKTED
jgi:predicted DNA-binding protein